MKPRIGSDSACIVTANLLYSHGYFVREISPAEQAELINYELELDAYNKELADFLHTTYINHPPAINWIYGHRTMLPRLQHAMPRRPILPSFCNSRETAIYKLNGCVVQNYRIFIGSLYVRNLNDEERREMDEYEYRLKEYQRELMESIGKPTEKRNNGNGIFTGFNDFPESGFANFEKSIFGWDDNNGSGESDDEDDERNEVTDNVGRILIGTTVAPTTKTTTPATRPPPTRMLPPTAPKFCSQLY
uniref:Pepsin-I3 domain-containing protein n=1 Tax=Panagrellus redivivus TaxID=6233 RepID=A0A7E4ZV30_PANRE